jgi:hypothetical protein
MRFATLLSAAVLHAVSCSGSELETFLSRHAGLPCPAESPAVRMLTPHAPNEIAAAGAVEIRTTIGEFLDRFRDIRNFKRAPEVSAIGLVNELPPDRQQRLAEMSARFVRSSAAREIAAGAAYLEDYAPDLVRVLEGKPAAATTEQFAYWSREKLVSAPVLTVTEASILYDKTRNRAFILTRQIFAESHYEASLGVTALFETSRGVCLVYLNRSRSAFFSGPFRSMRRSIAAAFIVPAMERKLAETRSRFEPLAAIR